MDQPAHNQKKIPGPSLVQYLFRTSKDLCLTHLELAEEYGKICKTPGPLGYYLISDPDYIEYILKTNANNYIKTDLGYKGIRKFLGDGLLTIPTLKEWLPERRLLQPTFQPQHVNQFATTIIDVTQRFCTRLEAFARKNKSFNLADEILELIFIITAHILFNGDFIQQRADFLRFSYLGNWYTCKGLYLFPWLPTLLSLRYYHSRRRVNQIILEVITKRRNQLHHPADLITALLAAGSLTTEKILDEIKTFLLTGHETTGTAIGWAFYLLAIHPNERQILQQELFDHLNGNPPTIADLEKLPYLQQVCEETLRLYPPIWIFTRRAVEADEIDGYSIPANKTIAISPFVMHHLKEYWDDPFIFDPSRFSKENKNKHSKFAYIPFGVGARSCIGSPLAFLQMQLIIATLIQKFDFISLAQKPIAFDPLISLKPNKGIWMRVEKCG